MTMILVIEDKPIQRIVAGRECSTRSGILMPETPDVLDNLAVEDLGLVVVAQHLSPTWEDAAQRLFERLRDIDTKAEFVNWTCVGPSAEIAVRPLDAVTLQKTGTAVELRQLIDRWL